MSHTIPTTYASGGTISGASADVILSGGTLQIQAGADIQADPTNRAVDYSTPDTERATRGNSGTSTTPGITAGAGTTVIVSGGSTTGDTWRETIGGELWDFTGGPGVFVAGGTLTMTGGSAVGGIKTSVGPHTGQSQGFGVVAIGSAVSISAGTITGGVSLGGTAPSTMTISGGTFTGRWAALFYHSGCTVEITGGTFTGGNGQYDCAVAVVWGAGAAQTTISGGTYTGRFLLRLRPGSTVTFTGTGLSFDGTTLTGTLSDGTPINNEIRLDAGSLQSSSSTAIIFQG